MPKLHSIAAVIFLVMLSCSAATAIKPNVVLVFMDNFGWGEPGFNGGGIIRGAPTPRLDQFAAEGPRLTNFNVEVQCTPSRSAIMTGRYAIRSGNGTVPLGEGVYGLVQWEMTMAEMLSDAGYATAMVGKCTSVPRRDVLQPTRGSTSGTECPTRAMSRSGRRAATSRRGPIRPPSTSTSLTAARAPRRRR